MESDEVLQYKQELENNGYKLIKGPYKEKFVSNSGLPNIGNMFSTVREFIDLYPFDYAVYEYRNNEDINKSVIVDPRGNLVKSSLFRLRQKTEFFVMKNFGRDSILPWDNYDQWLESRKKAAKEHVEIMETIIQDQKKYFNKSCYENPYNDPFSFF